MGKDKSGITGFLSTLKHKVKKDKNGSRKFDGELDNGDSNGAENNKDRSSPPLESPVGTADHLATIGEEEGPNQSVEAKRKSPRKETSIFGVKRLSPRNNSKRLSSPRADGGAIDQQHSPKGHTSALEHAHAGEEDSNGTKVKTPKGSPRTSPDTAPRPQQPAQASPPTTPHSTPSTPHSTPSTPHSTTTPSVHDLYFDEGKFVSRSGEVLQDSKDGMARSASSTFVPLPFERREKKPEQSPASKVRNSGPPEISPEDIEKGDLIGHGSFGSVYKGICRGQDVAVKVPKKQKLNMNELNSFRNEVKMMSKIYHPNVVLFLGACTALGKMQIVTERCMTDLEKMLASDKEEKQFSLYRRMQMAKDAALGINWLHGITGVIHHDLKTANLLVDHNFRVKVTDFGFSQIKEDVSSDKAKKGTPLWMAPEVMMGLNQKCDDKVDVYSFGIILWEILTRDVPYAHHNDYVTFFKAVCVNGERPPIPPDTLPSLAHLITSCWDADPDKRPNFEEIIFRLNEVLVDCAIENEDGRKLWKQHFLLPKQELFEEVPWLEFDTVIRKHLGKFDINLENIRNLIVSAPRDPMMKSKEVVTLERFDKVIKWFGPFFSGDGGISIVNEVNNLSTKSWFHGDITKEQAMERLAKQEAGTFLIRLSSTDPKATPFTLSMTGNQHRRIQRLDEGPKRYQITNKPTLYSTLSDLVERCRDYQLLKACPGIDGPSPYDPYKEITA